MLYAGGKVVARMASLEEIAMGLRWSCAHLRDVPGHTFEKRDALVCVLRGLLEVYYPEHQDVMWDWMDASGVDPCERHILIESLQDLHRLPWLCTEDDMRSAVWKHLVWVASLSEQGLRNIASDALRAWRRHSFFAHNEADFVDDRDLILFVSSSVPNHVAAAGHATPLPEGWTAPRNIYQEWELDVGSTRGSSEGRFPTPVHDPWGTQARPVTPPLPDDETPAVALESAPSSTSITLHHSCGGPLVEHSATSSRGTVAMPAAPAAKKRVLAEDVALLSVDAHAAFDAIRHTFDRMNARLRALSMGGAPLDVDFCTVKTKPMRTGATKYEAYTWLTLPCAGGGEGPWLLERVLRPSGDYGAMAQDLYVTPHLGVKMRKMVDVLTYLHDV